jgi:uncharacterized membrane protein YeiB
LLIGLVHTVLIWMGEILVTYAAIGLALIPFITRDDRTVLRWAGAMFVLPIPLYAALVMELVPGRTLAEIMAAGPMPLEEAIPIARQISEASVRPQGSCAVYQSAFS